MRGEQVGRVIIEISEAAWPSDPLTLPDDTPHALETDGRTEVQELLEPGDPPPRLVGCDLDGCTVSSWTALPEGEHVGLDTVSREVDLDGSVGDRTSLANQLIEPRFDDRPLALFVDVESTSIARRRSVDEDAKRSGRAWSTAHHEIDVSRVKAERDPSIRVVHHTRPLSIVQSPRAPTG